MPNSQVKDLTELTVPALTDVLYVQANPATTPLDRKVTVENLLKAVQDLATTATPTFGGVTASKTMVLPAPPSGVMAPVVSTTVNPSSGETHVSKFLTQDTNTGTIRALFACAGPLNGGVADQGYFDFINEAGTLFMMRLKSLATDGGSTLALFDRASPQAIQVHLHAAGTSYFRGGALCVGATSASDSADFYVAGKISSSGELEVNGAFNHDGAAFGAFGVAPVARRDAYTQTYSTADRTVANGTYSAPSGGTTVDTQARASLAQLAADFLGLKKNVNALIDDEQALGFAQ